jgi:prephenate dehydratase
MKLINGLCATLLTATLITSCMLHRQSRAMHSPGEKIFVQAGEGSFNHQALKLLLGESFESSDIQFAGTPADAMDKAIQNDGLVFTALENNLVPGRLIQMTVDALKQRHIVEVKKIITMKIEQCLLRHVRAIAERVPLEKIASHPAALLQIGRWKADKKLSEIAEAAGTSKAAELLSKGKYGLSTGVIGPKVAAEVYENLDVVECGIQDSVDNATTFGLLKVAKRNIPIDEAQARSELEKAVKGVW